jgi:hypothetical protein
MIPAADFHAYDLKSGEQPEHINLATVRDKMRDLSPPARRLPIRTASGQVLYVVHDSTLTAFAETQGQSTTTIDQTLGDMLATPEFKELVEALGVVRDKATVADARTVMASIKNCNDVFITPSGKRDDRAVGWVTNTLLAGVQ